MTPVPWTALCGRIATAFAQGSLALALATACGSGPDPVEATAPSASGLPRIVSINPSLTSILQALGATEALVGVDDFSARQQPAVAHLPRVGGLFNPSLEAVAALEPDWVVLVPSVEQRDFRARLEALGVRVRAFDNIRFDDVLSNIEAMGALVGREPEAAARVAAIRRTRAAALEVTADRERPRTVVVLQHDPVFVVGGGSFIAELLDVAGADNLGARFPDPYPRIAVEWLVDQAPEVVIDVTTDAGDPMVFWSRWPTMPAVANGRVLRLDPQAVTLPGPALDESIELLVAALHGPATAARLGARASASARQDGDGG